MVFLSWKNKALLLKWFSNFSREKNALWRKVFYVKASLQQEYIMPLMDSVRMSVGSYLTQDLLVLWRAQNAAINAFKMGLACKVGDGRGFDFGVMCGFERLLYR